MILIFSRPWAPPTIILLLLPLPSPLCSFLTFRIRTACGILVLQTGRTWSGPFLSFSGTSIVFVAGTPQSVEHITEVMILGMESYIQ